MGLQEGELKRNPEVYMEENGITAQMLDMAGYKGSPTGGTPIQQFVDDFDDNSGVIETPTKFLADKVEDYLSEDNLAQVARDIVQNNPDIQAQAIQLRMDASDLSEMALRIEEGLKLEFKENAIDGAVSTFKDINVFGSGQKELEGLTEKMQGIESTALSYAEFAVAEYMQTDPKGIAYQVQQDFPNVTADTGLTVGQLVQEQLEAIQESGAEGYAPDLKTTYENAVWEYENTNSAGVLKNLQERAQYENFEETTGYSVEEIHGAYMHAIQNNPDSLVNGATVNQFLNDTRDEFKETAQYAAIQQDKALEQKMDDVNQQSAFENKQEVIEYLENGGEIYGVDLETVKQMDFSDPAEFAKIENNAWQQVADGELQLKSLMTMDDMHMERDHLDQMALKDNTLGDAALNAVGDATKGTLSFLGEVAKGMVSDVGDVHVDTTGEKIGKATVDTVEGTVKGLWGIGEALVDAVQGDGKGALESLKDAGSSFSSSFDDNGIKADVKMSDHFKAACENTGECKPAANDPEYGAETPKVEEQGFLQKFGFN